MASQEPTHEELLSEIKHLKLENESLKQLINEAGKAQLLQNKLLYQKILNTIPDLVIQSDLEGNIVFVNDPGLKIFPFLNRDELIGESIFSFFTDDEVERARKNTLLMFEKPLGAIEYRIKMEGHPGLVCEISGDVLYDSNNKPFGMIYVIRDVTERKKADQALQNSEERFRLILENMPILLNAFDDNGNFVVWNKACEQSTGYTAEEIIGNPKAMELLYPDPVYRKKVMEMSADKDANINTFDLITKSGEKRTITWFDTYHYLKIPGWASWGLGQDITERKRAEEQLHLISLVLEQIQDCVTITDLNGIITYVNEAEQKLLGYTKEDLIGKSVHAYGDNPLKGASQDDILAKTIELGRWRGEVINKRSDGYEVVMDARTQVVQDQEGKSVAICGIATDITERKQMEDALRHERDLFSAGPVFTITWEFSEGFPVKQVSENVKDILGYSPQELLDKDFRYQSLLHPEDRDRTNQEVLNNHKNNIDAYEQSYRLKCKGGNYRWFYDFTKVDRDDTGQVKAVRGYLFDQTQIKQTELELILAKEQAEESDRLKNAFISNISHEIRTPLNSILGFGQFLVEPDLSQQERFENYELLRKSGQRLVQTITDIMDVSLITAGSIKPNKNTFYLNELMGELQFKTKRLCAEKNIVVKFDMQQEHAELQINNDKEILTKILDQLLSNSVKFTEKGRITFGYEIKNAYIEFFVKDTGKGIDPEKLGAIFDAFVQEDVSSTRMYEGSGLGLTIAKGLVKLLGGNMWVESALDKGSAFYFNTPFDDGKAAIAPEQEEPVQAVAKAGKGSLVLIAEDDEANYLYTNTVLRLSGISSLHALNGKEAIEMCREYPEIALVIMDIKMPVVNGLEATKVIREHRPDLPIIAVTAHAQTGDEHRMLEAGCNAYTAKPVEKKKLIELVRKFGGFES